MIPCQALPKLSSIGFQKAIWNLLNLKKLDIGGGIIHGNAADFRVDKSSKIILGHLSRPLNRSEKEIGSGAPFGTVDTIIPRFSKIIFSRCANDYLTTYFPNATQYQIASLLE